MIDPPELSTEDGRSCYVSAALEVTGVYHLHVARAWSFDGAMRHMRQDWPIYFTEEQQLAILAKMVELRLSK